MIGYCLTLVDDESMWAMEQLTWVLKARLEAHERVFFAFSALSALEDDEYESVISRMTEREV